MPLIFAETFAFSCTITFSVQALKAYFSTTKSEDPKLVLNLRKKPTSSMQPGQLRLKVNQNI